MKYIHLFLTVLCCWLMACSTEYDPETDDSRLRARFDALDVAYLHLYLLQTAQGTTSQTRANGDYDDGSADEYRLHDATLLLFTRKSTDPESDSRFLMAVGLTHVESSGVPVTSEVTQNHEYVAQLPLRQLSLPAGHNTMEAFVVANGGEQLSAHDDGSVSVNGETFGAGDALTFGTLIGKKLTDVGSLAEGLLMTSAPVADKAGGTDSPAGCAVTTLSHVDIGRLYATPEEAKTSPAMVAYLERAAAKVQLTCSSDMPLALDLLKIDKDGIRWDVDNENTGYYVSRHVKSLDLTLASTLAQPQYAHRFVGSSPLLAASSRYRIYWGEDVNYDDDTGLHQRYVGTQADLPRKVGEAVYTTENTVDEEHMKQRFSTGIVVSVPFYTGAAYTGQHIYGIAADGRFYTAELLKAKLTELASKTTIYEAWKTAHPEGTLTVTIVDADGTAKKHDDTVIPTGEVSFSLAFDPALDTEADLTTVSRFVEDEAERIDFYKEGRAYYKAMIKHFGDYETPLAESADQTQTYAGLYGSPADKSSFLGRFGVLRDTWYNIEIEGFRRMGSAVIPTFGDTPDDDTEYLRLRIVILPWMMHDQQLDF